MLALRVPAKTRQPPPTRSPRPRGGVRPGAWIALMFLGVAALAGLGHFVPLAVPVAYGAASFITFLVYWWDKRAATKAHDRVPEAWLHLLELLCGWPGALAAQSLLRHKSAKTTYQVTFWIVVLLNCAALYVYLNGLPAHLQRNGSFGW